MKPRGRAWAPFVLIHRALDAFGLNLLKTWQSVRGVVPYLRDFRAFAARSKESKFHFPSSTPFPCLADRFAESGTASGAYFHQDLHVAQCIFERAPERHVDVGSSVAGFVAHVACFRPVEVFDIRPLSTTAKNIRFRQLDLMGELPPEYIEYCDSLSCLHTLEHFGLGRYGDPVCPGGFDLGWRNLHRMLKPGGTLYFSVPLGRARIEFNAHRVFSVEQLKALIADEYNVLSFSYVDDAGDLHRNQSLNAAEARDHFGCHFGCAVLELKKK